MPLTSLQVTEVWEHLISAETRSLYFGDLASRYTTKKQWITGASFFFSSGAAATVIAKSPEWVPVALAVFSALATAYSIATNLDRRIAIMVKLHSTWSSISDDYEHLWSHVEDENAEERLIQMKSREKEPSEIATTDAPNDQELLGKWQVQVLQMYHAAN